MEKSDPLVQKIAEETNMDPEYLEMMNYIESDTEDKDVAPDCCHSLTLNLTLTAI